MEAIAVVPAVLLVLIVLWDVFETIVLPRRVARRFRLTRMFYRGTWIPGSAVARRMPGAWRETYLSFYGPLSLLLLFVFWAIVMIFGFGLLHWGLGSSLKTDGASGLGTDIYMSGSTFFTLGLGDVTPGSSMARAITVIEAGAGFGFLALVITYLPVLYQAFSRREIHVSLLDARAGSPPSAVELLRRLDITSAEAGLREQLRDWEMWCAELLESHLSYPVLAFYRSQHEHESWLAALTTILDACALLDSTTADGLRKPAALTFAMARHAAVDLGQVFSSNPEFPPSDRLPPADFQRVVASLEGSGLPLQLREDRLAELRSMYEPHVCGLSTYLLMPLPTWLPTGRPDDWQSSPWELGS